MFIPPSTFLLIRALVSKASCIKSPNNWKAVRRLGGLSDWTSPQYINVNIICLKLLCVYKPQFLFTPPSPLNKIAFLTKILSAPLLYNVHSCKQHNVTCNNLWVVLWSNFFPFPNTGGGGAIVRYTVISSLPSSQMNDYRGHVIPPRVVKRSKDNPFGPCTSTRRAGHCNF